MKNVHDLLAKLAWDFSPEQLDHLFDCFKVRCDSSERSSLPVSMYLIHQVYELL